MKRPVFFVIFFVFYATLFLVKLRFGLSFLFFITGLFIGFYFHVFDRIVQILVLDELKTQREDVVSLLKRGKWMAALNQLILSVEPISNSFYFLVLYIPLAFFMISSTGSLIGIGLILGLGLSYVTHFIWGYKHIRAIREAHFHLLSSTVTDQQIKMLMGVFNLLFVCISLLVLVRS